MAYTIVAFLHIPPSLPSFSLQSFTPLPLPPPPTAAADNDTIPARDWQVSFLLRNTNTKSLRSPAKHGGVLYDHINARLLLEGARRDPDHDVIASLPLPLGASAPFGQHAGQGSLVRLRFPGNGTAARARRCTVGEAAYSGLVPCRTVKFGLKWSARVWFGGTTRGSRKFGLVNVVCEDAKVFVSSDRTVVNGDSKECFVGGTWSSFHHVAKMAWSLIGALLILSFISCITCCTCFTCGCC